MSYLKLPIFLGEEYEYKSNKLKGDLIYYYIKWRITLCLYTYYIEWIWPKVEQIVKILWTFWNLSDKFALKNHLW